MFSLVPSQTLSSTTVAASACHPIAEFARTHSTLMMPTHKHSFVTRVTSADANSHSNTSTTSVLSASSVGGASTQRPLSVVNRQYGTTHAASTRTYSHEPRTRDGHLTLPWRMRCRADAESVLFALSGEHSSRFVREFFDVTHNMSSMFTARSRRAMYTRFGRALVRRVCREY